LTITRSCNGRIFMLAPKLKKMMYYNGLRC